MTRLIVFAYIEIRCMNDHVIRVTRYMNVEITQLLLASNTNQFISWPNERLVGARWVGFQLRLSTMAVIACVSIASVILSPQRSIVRSTLNTSTILCSHILYINTIGPLSENTPYVQPMCLHQVWTRKSRYHDRAMRPICECPENCRPV